MAGKDRDIACRKNARRGRFEFGIHQHAAIHVQAGIVREFIRRFDADADAHRMYVSA